MAAHDTDLPLVCKIQREVCDQRFESIHEKLELLDTKLERVLVAIEGNGKPGMKLDVDRLKQSQRKIVKIIWLGAGAIVVILTEWVKQRIGF